MALSHGSFTLDTSTADNLAEKWRDDIEVARAFIEHDPTTAYHRVCEIEAQVRAAVSTRSCSAAAAQPWLNYTNALRARALAAKEEWLAQCAERERQFRAREWRRMKSA